ncbi:alpha-L-fucosidase [Enterococcus hirae]|uniref:alpha-L-fucosidase n=1 Tax=Enterococcus hirae TaxID=1354 RepID=UPI0009C09ADE|nr:alpha-L-fucosidase [Enterococcus hirae]EMF0307680.1 alpha-L-fucosidase [Enterococcus hirae]EMF0458260.1 alpha-L-fucosidase [Enterococcus hirae]OQO33458.1 alpha-L-fucosidase [Enterococcus hirae]OQO39242.1 alpha-L-fucosidase [Enterococcus hirae]QQU11705.1 alpha-L-fucosidase [Enterococcus hirae]
MSVNSERKWFSESRYGLFIHFGLYSVAGRHEWVQTLEEISVADYQKYLDQFDPDLLDPHEWAQKAKEAGFKYVIITAKHHDGFCLWHTKETEYHIGKTPYQRDLLGELIEAFRQVGIKIGLYYSLLDWHHPDFLVDGYHPMRNNPTYIEQHPGNMENYRQFMANQVRELLTSYGTIDYLWFDFSYKSRDWGTSVGKGEQDWGSVELEKMIHEIQPNILINDRLDLHRGVLTPEQFARSKAMDNEEEVWETVQTLNNSWGYDRDNLNFKTSEMVAKQLVDTVSKGGNFTMNIGPNARGEWDDNSDSILSSVGQWLRKYGKAIYGAGLSSFTPPQDCRYTQKGNKLYLHIFSWPYRTILLPELGGKVKFAKLLNDGSEIRFVDTKHLGGERKATTNLYKEITEVHVKEALDPSMLMLNIPIKEPNELIPVIELTLKEEEK